MDGHSLPTWSGGSKMLDFMSVRDQHVFSMYLNCVSVGILGPVRVRTHSHFNAQIVLVNTVTCLANF